MARLPLMDAFDRKILAELQSDGRLTHTEIAERVGLSLSPCHRRIRALEESGVIKAYKTHIDAEAVGLRFSAIVFVTMHQGHSASVQAFEDAVLDIPEVISAQRLFGEPDYVLTVLTANLASYRQLYDQRLSSLPGVLRLNSTLVMKEVVRGRSFPIPAA